MLKQAALLRLPQDADGLKLCLSLQSAYLTGLIGETSWREARPAFFFLFFFLRVEPLVRKGGPLSPGVCPLAVVLMGMSHM